MRAHKVSAIYSNLGPELAILWKFAVPALLLMTLDGPVMWAGNVLLVRQTNGYAEMGVFNAANQWRGALLFLPGIVAPSFLAVLSNLNASGQKKEFRHTVTISFIIIAAVAAAPGAIVAIGAGPIMGAYGKGFENNQATLVIIAASSILAAAALPFIQMTAALGKMWYNVAVHTVWAVVFLLVIGLCSTVSARTLAFCLPCRIRRATYSVCSHDRLGGQSQAPVLSGFRE